MKKYNTSPISGMQELTPKTQAVFNRLKSLISATYHAHGFLGIETPTIDRTEILFAKAGGDTEKQIYKVVKTAETADDASQALRFDHTVPLARYVVQHQSQLTFPFKVTQIGRNFRGERAQKGRFREFYQCDIDVIGRDQLPLAYDADIINTLLDTFSAFKLKAKVLARISNRKLLSGLLESLNLTPNTATIFNIIDHAEKVPASATLSAFESLGLSAPTIAKITAFMDIHGPASSVIPALKALNIDHPTFNQGITELEQVLNLLSAPHSADPASTPRPQSPTARTETDSTIADMKIIRGLDYYTGTVFEFNLIGYEHIGSVCGGGRYENLTTHFSPQAFPGVGGSIGLTRLFYVLTENNLLESQEPTLFDYCLIPVSSAEIPSAFALARQLRARGASVDIVLFDKKLGDKIAYATKIAQNGIVIGESEVQTGDYQVKNFATHTTTPLAK